MHPASHLSALREPPRRLSRSDRQDADYRAQIWSYEPRKPNARFPLPLPVDDARPRSFFAASILAAPPRLTDPRLTPWGDRCPDPNQRSDPAAGHPGFLQPASWLLICMPSQSSPLRHRRPGCRTRQPRGL